MLYKYAVLSYFGNCGVVKTLSRLKQIFCWFTCACACACACASACMRACVRACVPMYLASHNMKELYTTCRN